MGECIRCVGEMYTVLLAHHQSPVPRGKLSELWALWNKSCSATTPSSSCYMPSVLRAGKSEPEYVWAQALRFGMGLARLKYLRADQAADEGRMGVLLLQRLKLGFPISGWNDPERLGELQQWSVRRAPAPMTTVDQCTGMLLDGGRTERNLGEEVNVEAYGGDANTFKPGVDASDMVATVLLEANADAEDKALVGRLTAKSIAELDSGE